MNSNILKHKAMTKTITIIIGLLFCLHVQSFKAQSTTMGPLVASNASNNTSIGTISWSTTASACQSDDVRATASALLIGDKTNYLVLTGFGFNIPYPSAIDGIAIEVEGSATGLLQIVKDYSIKIVKGGVITGTDHAGSANWPGSDAFSSYGSNADLWGTTWTESDINASNFGVAISANLTSLSVVPTARIDMVRVTVYYQSTLPITLSMFNATRIENDIVKLEWQTQVETNNDFFTIERSLDGYNWQAIGRIKGSGNSEKLMSYQFMDENPLNETMYYRLKQTDYNGLFVYSNVLDVVAGNSIENTLKIYPNPFSDEIIINATHEFKQVELSIMEAETGKNVVKCPIVPAKKNTINTSNLDKGVYIMTIVDGDNSNRPIKLIKSN